MYEPFLVVVRLGWLVSSKVSESKGRPIQSREMQEGRCGKMTGNMRNQLGLCTTRSEGAKLLLMLYIDQLNRLGHADQLIGRTEFHRAIAETVT